MAVGMKLVIVILKAYLLPVILVVPRKANFAAFLFDWDERMLTGGSGSMRRSSTALREKL